MMLRQAFLTFLFAASAAAAPLPDAVYAEVAAGIPDGVLDLTTVPGPGVYELTDAKPGLTFNLFDDATVLATGVTLKPTENVARAIVISGGTQAIGPPTKRLQATGVINPGTTQLDCHYITGNPVAEFISGQEFHTTNTFTLANATGFSMCWWTRGDDPVATGFLFDKMGSAASRELLIAPSGGVPEFWIVSGVTAAAGGQARIHSLPPQFNGETGVWTFFAIYFNQAGNQMGISCNGGPFTTLATTGTLTAPGTLTKLEMGARPVKLSNVWLWKGRVLTLAEFQAIYNAGIGRRYTDLTAGQKTGLLHAWEMSEVAGVDREDSHGTNDLDEVGGAIAQSMEGWTGTFDQPLTNIMSVGDRLIINCGVQIYDAQEPEYTVFREVSAITGNTITFSEPFPFACTNFVNSGTMLALGADPEKVGIWGGNGETAFLHPYGGANSFGFLQRGWGTSHDLILFESGRPNSGLTIQGLTIDYSSSTHSVVTNDISASYSENVRFEDLTMIRYRGNALLFDRCNNSGVDGYTIRGDATMAAFGPGTNFASPACALWGGSNIYFRNVDIEGRGIYLFTGESGSIDAVVENARLIGGDASPGQTWGGQHFGVYSQHFQTDGVVGVKFRDCYFDTPTFPGESRYFTTATAGLQITNMTFAGGEIPEFTPWKWFQGQVRVGNRIFGPRTMTPHPLSVFFSGGAYVDVPVPTGLYLEEPAWPVLTIDNRTGLDSITPGDGSQNLLATNPTGLALNFANNTIAMTRWTTAPPDTPGTPFQSYLDGLKLTFDPTGSPVMSRSFSLTANYFPEVTSTVAPRTPVVASTGGVLRAANGKSIALVAAP